MHSISMSAHLTFFGSTKNIYNEDFCGQSVSITNIYNPPPEEGWEPPFEMPDFDDDVPDEFNDPEIHNEEEVHNEEEAHHGNETHTGESEYQGPVTLTPTAPLVSNGEAEFNGPVTTNNTLTTNGPVTNNAQITNNQQVINNQQVNNNQLVTNNSNVHTLGTTTNEGAVTNNSSSYTLGTTTNAGPTNLNGPVTVNAAFALTAASTFGAAAAFNSSMSLSSTASLSALAGAQVGFASGVAFNVGANSTYSSSSNTTFQDSSHVTYNDGAVITNNGDTGYGYTSTVSNLGTTTWFDNSVITNEATETLGAGYSAIFQSGADFSGELQNAAHNVMTAMTEFSSGATVQYDAGVELTNAAHNVMTAMTEFAAGASAKIDTGASLDVQGAANFDGASVAATGSIFALDSTSWITANNFMPKSRIITLTGGTADLDENGPQVIKFIGTGGDSSTPWTDQGGAWYLIINDCTGNVTIAAGAQTFVFATLTSGILAKTDTWSLVGNGSTSIISGGDISDTYGTEGTWTPVIKFDSVEPDDYTVDATFIKQKLDATKFTVTLNYRITINDYGLADSGVVAIEGVPWGATRDVYCTINFVDSTPEGFTQLNTSINGSLIGSTLEFVGGGLIDFSSGDVWSGSLTYVCL